MSDRDYAVVFDGTVAAGMDVAAVKSRLGALFKIPAQQVERLFTGQRITLKKGLDLETARRMSSAMHKTGAISTVVRMAPGPKSPAPSPLSVESLSTLFSGDFEKQRPAMGYRLGLIGVAALMLCLPLLYLAMVVGIVTAVIGYVASGALTSTHNPYLIFLRALPVFAGVVMVLFLLKPLFAPRVRVYLGVELTPAKQPLFFAFINAVADKVGAPRPRSVQVDCQANAAASYYRGFRGLRRNELTLVVGIPLLAGMNTRQLAGVLAHEFGHFSQRAGMLATYVIRRINFEFYRAVAERDVWDTWLGRWVEKHNGLLGLPAVVAQLGIGLVRQVLAVFHWLADVMSYFMLRQMEFDADTYEARLAGSAQFRDTSLRLRQLDWAFDEIYDDLGELWNKRQLVDDLPTMVARKAATLPPGVLQKIEETLQDHRQVIFSTHPPDEARIAAAQALAVKGIFAVERPAYELLANAEELARQVTLRFYRHTLDITVKPEQLVSKEAMTTVVNEARQQDEALNEYFRALFIAHRFLTPAEFAQNDTPDDDARRSQLDDLVAKIRQALPNIERQRAHFDRLTEQLAPAYAARALRQHQQPMVQSLAKELSVRGYGELQAEMGKLKEKMTVNERHMMKRMALALQGAAQRLGVDPKQLSDVIQVTQTLHRLQSARDELDLSGAVLFYALQAEQILREQTGGAEGLPMGFGETWSRSVTLCRDNIEAALDRVRYPLECAGGQQTVWAYMSERFPPRPDSPDEQVEYVRCLDAELTKLYGRLMRYLADIARRSERHLGVAPLRVELPMRLSARAAD